MNYEETLTYLYDFAPMFQKVGSSAYKEGMENSFRIDEHLNHPHTKYKTIHVGGTNGKGSTSHLLASVLQEAGYKTGLYTSPHLLDFRERIKVNGEMISKDFIVRFIAENKEFFESIQPSFFELTTGLAFAYFAEQEVDVAVIEVGLGGRLDCTNVISPVLSIITNISFDHTNLLGNTLEKIATEKAGIIKPHIPVIIGESQEETKDVFIQAASRNKSPLIFAEEQKPILSPKLLPSGYWEFDTKEYPELIDQLGGFAQEKNAATVLCAITSLRGGTTKQSKSNPEIEQLDCFEQTLAMTLQNKPKDNILEIPPKAVYKGFRHVIENTGLKGRWQIIQYGPKIVMDTGHNVGGMEYIVRQLQSERYDKLHIVFGMVSDKDISSVLKMLPKDADYYFTKADIPRALPENELAEKASAFGLKGKIYPNVKEAFFAAKENASEKDFIFVGGSTFIVADALAIVTRSI